MLVFFFPSSPLLRPLLLFGNVKLSGFPMLNSLCKSTCFHPPQWLFSCDRLIPCCLVAFSVYFFHMQRICIQIGKIRSFPKQIRLCCYFIVLLLVFLLPEEQVPLCCIIFLISKQIVVESKILTCTFWWL